MIRHRLKKAIVWAAFACFACRMVIPAGYMPAPLSEGGPVVLCYGGFDGALLERALSAHHRHQHSMHMAAHDPSGGMGSHSAHDASIGTSDGSHSTHDHSIHDHSADTGNSNDGDSGSTHDAWKHCPVGTLFATAALTATFSLPLLDLSFERPAVVPFAAPRTAVTASYQSRAPPASLHV